MITVMATLKLKPGSGPEFEKVFTAIAHKAKASEPETLLYKLVRSQTDPNEYRAVEFYVSKDSLQKHMTNPETAELMANIAQFFSGAPDFAVLDDVVTA